jgi:hypothetical protein
VNVVREDGKPVYGADGKILKKKVKMADGKFANGSAQSLYFADDDKEHAGKFKGMATILAEWGFENTSKIQAECVGFKCNKGATNCCCRCILYNQRDFVKLSLFLRLTAGFKAFKSSSYPNSTMSSILLSSAGAMLSRSTVCILFHQRRLISKPTYYMHWTLFLLSQCDDMQILSKSQDCHLLIWLLS